MRRVNKPMKIVTRAWSIDNKIAIASKSTIGILIIPKIISTTKTSPFFYRNSLYTLFFHRSIHWPYYYLDWFGIHCELLLGVIVQINLTRNCCAECHGWHDTLSANAWHSSGFQDNQFVPYWWIKPGLPSSDYWIWSWLLVWMYESSDHLIV
jgi:hypothetical protein